ncbi:hypothetical protein HAX54_040491, partial [Datura stramonium]|nr:hypothetical protein [Datura stramonium]
LVRSIALSFHLFRFKRLVHRYNCKSELADGAGTSQSPELVKNEETAEAHHNELMSLIRSLSAVTVLSPSIAAPSPPPVP